VRIGEADALCWFGATGDLGFKKTFPSLYAMAKRGRLNVPIIGIARDTWTLDHLKERGKESIDKYGGGVDDPEAFDHLMGSLHYVGGDYSSEHTFTQLRSQLDAVGSKAPCHYLAVPPSLFPTVVQGLATSGCADNARVVVEKPFGRDLESAQRLNQVLLKVFPEPMVFRIDHYLGKDEVQNLSYVRFANSVFEPIWNRDHIRSVEITMAEDFGVEGRGRFYEEAGTLRDVVENHLFQIVALLAMSPPTGHDTDAFRDEKERIFRAMRTISRDEYVRGQFVGYRDEDGVADDSDVETFAAVRLHLDSWRWEGVPWYLRAGKEMPCHTTEVLVEFNGPPHRVFPEPFELSVDTNYIRFRLSPRPLIGLGVRTLVPSDEIRGKRTELVVSEDMVDERLPYERLLGDALEGDHFLFTSQNGVEAAWEVVDKVLLHHASVVPYQPKTWGPVEADKLIEDGRGWAPPSIYLETSV
jgi:glucose-6-phosphate 1-dehydrogenase